MAPDPVPATDPTPTPETPAAAVTDPPTPATPPVVDPPVTPEEDEAFDKDRAMRTIHAQRAEEARLRAENAKLKAEKEQREAAERSELEQAQHKAATLEEQATTATAKLRETKLLLALAKPENGIADPQAATKLITGIEFDENDEPTNLADRLQDAVAQYPILASTAKPPAPRVNGGDGEAPGPKPNLTAEEIQAAQEAGMTPERFEAMKSVTTLEDWQKLQKQPAPATT